MYRPGPLNPVVDPQMIRYPVRLPSPTPPPKAFISKLLEVMSPDSDSMSAFNHKYQVYSHIDALQNLLGKEKDSVDLVGQLNANIRDNKHQHYMDYG